MPSATTTSTEPHRLAGVQNRWCETFAAGLPFAVVLAMVANHVGYSSGRSLDNDLVAAVFGRLDVGAAIAFVLVGFWWYRAVAGQSASGLGGAGASAWRRVLVFVLPLWLTVTVTFLFLSDGTESPAVWLRHLFLVPAFHDREFHPYLQHLWIVGFAVAVGALLSLYALIAQPARRNGGWLARHRLLPAGLPIVVAVAYNVIRQYGTDLRPADRQFLLYLDWFGLGMLIAAASIVGASDPPAAGRLHGTMKAWATSPGTCWLVAGLLWSLSMTQLGVPRSLIAADFWQWTAQHVLFGAAAFFVVLPLAVAPAAPLNRAAPGSVGSASGTFAYGTIAYGTFLWHFPVLLAIQRAFGLPMFDGNVWVLLVLTTVAAVAAAAVTWFLVQRPILRARARIVGARFAELGVVLARTRPQQDSEGRSVL